MGTRKGFFAVLFLALCVSAVNAYTVVMRDGRRVEIPNEFTVTNSTLTYQLKQGFQVTIQLNTVDIAATERANGETQGSFALKAKAPTVPVEPAPQTVRATAERSITNADLEKYRRARVEGENQRQELGLPSVQERQREVAEIEDRTVEHVRDMRAREEAVWRARAEAMQAERAANEAMRQRSDIAYPVGGGYSGFGPFDGIGFGVVGGGFNRFRRFPSGPLDGFLATPITRFPDVPFDNRRGVFSFPRVRNSRPNHRGHGSRR